MTAASAWAVAASWSALWAGVLGVASGTSSLPWGLRAVAFFTGLVTAPAVILVATIARFTPWVGQAATLQQETPLLAGIAFFFGGVALLEEVGLWLLSWGVLLGLRTHLSARQGGGFAVTAALGFAAVENARYLQDIAGGGEGLTAQPCLDLLAVRAVLPVLAHVVSALLWGPCLSAAYVGKVRGGRAYLSWGILLRGSWRALAAAITVHALYDALQWREHVAVAAALLGAVGTGTLLRRYELPQTSAQGRLL